jgi:hypothetical protein
MLLVFVGIGLIVSAALFFVSQCTNISHELPTFRQLQQGQLPISMRPSMLTGSMGLIFILLGLIAIPLGAYQGIDNNKYFLLAAIFALNLSIQARLIIYGLTNKNDKIEKENLFSVLRKAFSIGIFPTGNVAICFLVHVFQLIAVLSLGTYFVNGRV